MASSSYFRKFHKSSQEAILGGNITDETPAAATMNEIVNQILMGVEGYEPIDWVKQYTTDKAIFSVPIGTYGAASTISGGAFTNANKSQLLTSISR